MSSTKLVVQGAAGALGGAGLDVNEVFSTYLYTGNGSTQTITNGIDLDGEGGLTWLKHRSSSSFSAADHWLIDTERGGTKYIRSNSTAAQSGNQNYVTFNSDGFTLGTSDAEINFGSGNSEYASWTFRKAPKFFDVVTYTGDGTAGRTVSHNLGSVPGCIIVKRTDAAGNDWYVYHRGVDATAPEDYHVRLNVTNARTDFTTWNDTAPTSTEFTVGSFSSLNGSGGTFVAYLFAHNDGDGEFGPDGDLDAIKCGSFTTDANGDASIDLGFEPQWVLLKRTDAAQSWWLADTMRGMTVGTAGTAYLVPDQNYAEDSTYTNYINPTATGFGVDAFSGSASYIYIAIRRGPMAVPEDADDVFAIDRNDQTAPTYEGGFPVDMGLLKQVDDTNSWLLADRLRGKSNLVPNATDAESTNAYMVFDYMEGWNSFGSSSAYYSWMWRRAPNFFDVVAYTGNGTAGRTVSHNLGVAPEMMWVKRRDSTGEWMVYHSGMDATAPEDYYMRLNETGARSDSTIGWNDTAPTASVFSLGSHNWVNGSSNTYIAYLFASLDGVSKVGSYTGNGSTQTIDCGFSAGARFVLIKRTDSTGSWIVYDTERGIVSGDDAALLLQSSGAEYSGADEIDPNSSGFDVVHDANGFQINASGGTYIFYAIA